MTLPARPDRDPSSSRSPRVPEGRGGRRTPLSRADLPETFTPETVRELPLSTLRQLAGHRNAVLDPDEQRAFDTAVHQVMRETAERVSRRLGAADWSTVRRGEGMTGERDGAASTQAERQLRRLARRIGQQVEVAETLSPSVDWSFARAPKAAPEAVPPAAAPVAPAQAPSPDDEQGEGTVSDLEARITEQAELLEVMTQIADMTRRTYALEQQRDLQNTRTVFFGFVVSVAVLASGFAPLVEAHDWAERVWIIGLTLGTCVLAALVYGLVRRRQNRADEQT